MSRRALEFVGAVTTSAIVFACSGHSAEEAPGADLQVIAEVVVQNGHEPGGKVPLSAVGISLPVDYVTNFSEFAGLTNLLNNFQPYQGPIWLRRGGDGACGASMADAQFLSRLGSILAATGSPMSLCLDFESNSPAEASRVAKAVLDYFGTDPGKLRQIVGFEVGNEPDLYLNRTFGAHTYTEANWGYEEYLEQFDAYKSALYSSTPPILTKPFLIGTVAAGSESVFSKNFLNNQPGFISRERAVLSSSALHYYPLSHPVPTLTEEEQRAKIESLLSNSSVTKGVQKLAGSIDAGATAGVPARLGEANSVSGGGQKGVSDTAAAALWGADLLFEVVNAGAIGINFTLNDGFYNPFTIEAKGASDPQITVNPLYYGMLFFAQVVQNDARFVTADSSTQKNIKTWALKDKDGNVRVAILNKDMSASGTVVVTLENASAQGLLTRLDTPSATASTGLKLGCQTFDKTKDGKPIGTLCTEPVDPTGSSYRVNIKSASAAILMIKSPQ